jgi:hypothetical protein
MATNPLTIRPGVDVVKTPRLVEAGWATSNLVRFFQGLLQKRGGWARLTKTNIKGTARALHAFEDLQSVGYIGIGTDQLLELYSQGSISDITPLSRTSNLTNPFSTQSGSSIVTVLDAGHSRVPGDWVYVATAAYVGGLVLQGLYQVLAIAGSTYTFDAGVLATATITGGTTFTFTTQSGSTVVTFTLGAATFTTGQKILAYVPTTLGGITLSGNFAVTVSGGTNQITAATAALSNATASENGGQVQILYPLNASAPTVTTFAYGAGRYGAGLYGVGEGTVQAAGAPTSLFLRDWSLDNWGQFLLASPLNGPLYVWQPPITYNNRATLVGNAPGFSAAMFVAMPQQQVVSLGSDAGGFQDPLLLKFSDIGDYTSWTPTAINSAGSFRISRGSRLVGGISGERQAFIWTDLDLWSMNFLGGTLVYGFDTIARKCGLLAKRGAAMMGSRLFWVGANSWFTYDGSGVAPLKCPVWDRFFSRYDRNYIGNIHLAANTDFAELELHFPINGSGGLPVASIKYKVDEDVWDYSENYTRTAWLDRSDIGPPIGVDGPNGLLQAHETAIDADGAAMPSFAETGWFTLANGTLLIFIERLLPNFTFNSGGKVLLTVTVAEYDGDPNPRIYGPYTVTATTRYCIVRAEGRFAKLKVDFSSLGSFARMGLIQAVMAPAGRR